MPSLTRVGIIQSTEGPNRTKTWREGESALRLSWDIHLLLSLDISVSGFQAVGLRLELISSAPLILRSCDVGFLVLCLQRQTMGFLSLHHHVHPLLPHLGLSKCFSVFDFNVSAVFFKIIFLYFLSGRSRHLSIHI